MKRTKLVFTSVGFIFGIVIASLGVLLVFQEKANGVAVLGQGLGLVTLVLGIYTTGNVAQKKVISQNYRPELDKEK
jgi:uncharacterized membrane protein